MRNGPHDYDWPGVPLIEPGISEVDDGRWSRLLITCRNCPDQRKVWKGVDREKLAFIFECPNGKRAVEPLDIWMCALACFAVAILLAMVAAAGQ